MNKLAHSNQETMDWIEFKQAIENGNEDLIFEELKRLRGANREMLRALEVAVLYVDDCIEFSNSRGLRNIGAIDAFEKTKAAIAKARA